MSRIKRGCAASLTIVGAFAAPGARAHAPPEINRVVWSPAGDQVVLVTNRGLIFNTAQSGGWSMMCGAALGTGPVSESEVWPQPDVAYLADGRLLAATSRGLRASADGGCAWRAVAPFETADVGALAQHPSDPNTLYVSVSSREGASLQKTRDGGASWSRALPLGSGEVVTRLLFAPMHPARIYATLALAGSTGGVHALLRSSDDGANWKRSAIPLAAGERMARLVAVSPRDPELLLVLIGASDRESQSDRILISRNGGETFGELWSSMGLHDAGFGPDGASVWIAGDEALWQSDPTLTQMMPVGMAQLVTCVGAHAGSLYVCGHHSGFDPSNSGVGISSDGGRTFQRHMTFTEVTKRVRCEPSSETARACQADWTDWQLEILVALGGAPIDAVLGDAGPGAAAGAVAPGAGTADADAPGSMATPRARAGTGCSVSRSRSAGVASLLGSCVGWLIALRFARRYLQLRRPRSTRSPMRPSREFYASMRAWLNSIPCSRPATSISAAWRSSSMRSPRPRAWPRSVRSPVRRRLRCTRRPRAPAS